MPISVDNKLSWRKGTKKRNWLAWRWLLLAPFIIGYLLTYPILQEGIAYLALTLAAIGACALLLTRMHRSLYVTLKFWTILAIFMTGYYIKYYWIVLNPDVLMDVGQLAGLTYSASALLPAFKLATISFASFCITAWVFLGAAKRRTRSEAVETDRFVYRAVGRSLIWIIPSLMLVTYVVAYNTGITIMGLPPVSLPFRLAGFIFYTRTVLIPAFLLLLIFCGKKGGTSFQRRLGILLLIVHGLSDVLLRSSRGQLTVLLLALGFLFLLVGGKIKRSEVAVLLIGFMFTTILVPFITEYRNYRIQAQDKNIGEALVWTIKDGIDEKGALGKTFTNGMSFILTRITGIEMLIFYTSIGVMPLGFRAFDVIRSPKGIAGYVTIDLYRIPEQANTSSAVSLPGWFYLLGGQGFMALGVIFYVLLIGAIWNRLQRLRLRILPVAQALFLLWVYSVTVEGTLDSQIISFIALAASILICEWLIRKYEKKPRRILAYKHSSSMLR